MTSHSDSLNSKTVSNAAAPQTWSIAVLPGDGIGPEVVAEGVKVLRAVAAKLTGVEFQLTEYPVGAAEYLRNGNPLPEKAFAACEKADAVLLGAMGLPSVRWPNGKEMTPQIDLREKLDLYNGVRPIRLYHDSAHAAEKIQRGRNRFRASCARAPRGFFPRGSPSRRRSGRSLRRDAHHARGRGAHLPRGVWHRAETPQAAHAGGQGERAALDGFFPRSVRRNREGISRRAGQSHLCGCRRAVSRATPADASM